MASKIPDMDVKRVNRRKVYRQLLQFQRVSKQELSKILDISLPTVAQNVRELIALGLAEEKEAFASTGGRKAAAIAPVPNARAAVGLSITPQRYTMVCVNLLGQIISKQVWKKDFSLDEEYLSQLRRSLEEFLVKCPVPRDRILGVGVTLPGSLSADRSTVISSRSLAISNLQTETLLSGCGLPCRFLNDSHAAAITEFWDQENPGNLVYLSLNSSVGGSFSCGGQLYSGDRMHSCDFGQLAVIGKDAQGQDRAARLEDCCSSQVLAQAAGGSLERFFQLVEAGDPSCCNVWQTYSGHLCRAAAQLHAIFDCGVVLGGEVGSFLAPHLSFLRRMISDQTSGADDVCSYLTAGRYPVEPSAAGAALTFIRDFFRCF
mgnify:FL=1